MKKIKKRSRAKSHAPSALRDDGATLAWLREMMREFVAERAWQKYHTPRNLAASVAVEAGELLELFQWWSTDEGDRRKKELMQDSAFKKAVGEELCDVMMYCVSLANAMDLEIAPTIAAKMAKNRLKYPPERFHGHYERPLET
jgi:NTP pyrophosphatase (non-canonical NTP hydrolase)